MPDDSRGSSFGSGDALMRLALMLLLGGAVALPLVTSSTTSRPSAPGAAGAPASSSAGGAAPGSTAEEPPRINAMTLLADFAGIDSTPTAVRTDVQQLRSAFDDRSIRVEFIIATVPDPIDSNARWTFDPMVAAIEGAAAASGYVLDRFYIPDWDPARDASGDHVSTSRTVHERWPAIVLFRNARFDEKPANRSVLVTALVAETPTSGIHQQAFNSAVSLAFEWRGRDPAAPIRVLGPSFTGSVPSLSLAIDGFKRRPATGEVTFRVVTGGATDADNQRIVEATGRATFRSTVLPDDFVKRKAIRFLVDTDPSLVYPGRLALLFEGNTTYGSSLTMTGGTAGRRSRRGQDCSAMDGDQQADCLLDNARQLPFPLHISRLRSAANVQNRQAPSAATTPRFLALPLDEATTATDQIPSLSPRSTSSSAELVIANILDTIDREHVTTVGLFATDTRDKLFLAEQIAKRDATVRLFTIESDLFYIHPDYVPYVRGMIVASTYPIFNQNQRWVSGSPTQVQFPTTNAQGMYNAMLALLNYTDSGDSATPGGTPPQLLDYVTPRSKTPLPPAWISAVGHDAIWPMTWYEADTVSRKYLQPITVGMPAGDVTAHASGWANFAFVLLIAIVAAHVGAYSYRHRVAQSIWGHRAFLKIFALPGFHRRTPYALVAFSALLVAYGYACDLFLLSVWKIGPSLSLGWTAVSAVAAFFTALLLLALFACIWDLARGTIRGAFARVRALSWKRRVDPQYALMAIALTAAIAAAVFGALYLRGTISADPSAVVYYFQRATHPQNGVSPALPLAFILGAVYLWAFAHLRRLTAVSGSALAKTLVAFDIVAPGVKEAAMELKRFVDGVVQAMPWSHTTTVLVAVIIATYVVLLNPLSTPEPAAFTAAFRAAWLLVQVLLLLAFAHVVYFWQVLRRTLRPFARTPMIAAFDRLPPVLFGNRLSPHEPDPADMHRAIRAAGQLGLVMRDIERSRRAAKRPPPYDEFGLTAAAYSQLANELVSAPDASPHPVSWAETPEWLWLRAASWPVARVVAHAWRTQKRENMPATLDFDADTKDVKDDLQRWFLRAEEFLALQVLLIVRELLARLVNICFIVMVGVLLMVGAQQSFPFQPRQELLGTAWVYVLSAVALVLWIFIKMEHDPVLSALASTEAGAIRWDAKLWSRVLLYGVIPIATIFAAQFPQIGNTLLGWLTPVARAF